MGKAIINILVYANILVLLSCKEVDNKNMYKEDQSSFTINRTQYESDRQYLNNIFEHLIVSNKRPFHNKTVYDRNTELYVDSIIYSPNKLRLIVFLITKNEVEKLQYKEDNLNDFFFNAHFFYCSRDSLLSKIKVYDYSSFTLVRYPNYNSVKRRLYQFCFTELSNKGTKGFPMYNMDDPRFWNSEFFNFIVSNKEFIQL